MQHLTKIIIIGDAGRGKSVLAANMSAKLGIPKYTTDDFFYEIKYSKPRDKAQSIRDIHEVYIQDQWIVEGTTSYLLQEGLELADKIIYLRYKSIFPQWLNLYKRHLKYKNETFSELLFLMKHVFKKRYGLGDKKGKKTHMQVVAPYKEKLTILTSFKQIDAFLLKEFGIEKSSIPKPTPKP